MPTPTRPITIGIEDTNLNEGEYVKVTNFTSGGTIRAQVDKNKHVLLEPSNSGHTWSSGDSIIAEINGRIIICASSTISKGGARFKFTATADTSMPQVNL